jgi:AraC-like DNA-binding protein
MDSYFSYPISEAVLLDDFQVFFKQDLLLDGVYLHHHDFYEIYLFLSGNVQYIIDGRKYDLMEGDLVFIQPNQLHQPVFLDNTTPYKRYVLWLKKSYFHEPSAESINNPANDTFLCNMTATETNAIIALLNLLINEQKHDPASYDCESAKICGATIQTLLALFRRLRKKNEKPRAFHFNDTLLQVMNYIDSHINEAITLDELSGISYLSKFHLARKFKEEMGISIYQYCIKKRLILARNLMDNGIPITKAYQKCGFNDYSNFYRAYRKEYGIPPRDHIADKLQIPLH